MKTSDTATYRGFESHPLRHSNSCVRFFSLPDAAIFLLDVSRYIRSNSGQRSLTILKLKGVELLNNDYKINKENFALAIYYDIISISTCLKTRNSNQVNFGFCVYVEKL